MKRTILVFVAFSVLAWSGLAYGQNPPDTPDISVDPAYYFNSLVLVSASGKTSIVRKEYTKFADIPESDRILGEFPAGEPLTIEGKGALPQQGYEWERKEIRIGTDSIFLDIFTKSDRNGMYPDAIEGFDFSFEVPKPAPGSYDLFLCKKCIGKVVFK